MSSFGGTAVRVDDDRVASGISRRRFLRALGGAGAALGGVHAALGVTRWRGVSLAAAAGPTAVVEEWSRHTPGSHGIPEGWTAYETPGGHPRYDFTVVDDGGRRALSLKSTDDHSTIARRITVSLATMPVLEWEWKVVELPQGADLRRKATSDVTGHLFVVWPRPPAILRSRLIGYVWDPALPAGTVLKSAKVGAVYFVVVRSGPAGLGTWKTERRDVRADYRRVFEEDPPDPQVVAISIDTNDTRSSASALIGRISFTAAASSP